MHKNKLLTSAAVLMVLFSVGAVWALNADYNRPNPLIDYVAQEIAIYDTRYDELGEMDCRACHGDSLADRHHNTLIVLRDNLCTPCHEVIPDPPGVTVTRDCTTAGCHGYDDVYANGWHHNTDLSASENCTACHDTNIVNEITPFSSFAQYPPSVVTPTPFSCENCHWEQELVDLGWTSGDPDPAEGAGGHPSSYDHYDSWGNFVGYYEYGKSILGNFDTHHMGFKGNVAAQCWKCHSNDPNDPSWDPYEPELIRYCEICHDISTLHTIYPHVGPTGTDGGKAYEGWVATGFHAGGGGSEPVCYIGDNADGISGGPAAAFDPDNPLCSATYFEANDMCWGCHGDAIPPYEGAVASAPTIIDFTPKSVCPTGLVEISGSGFGIEKTPEASVKLKEGTVFVEVPIYSWTDSLIIIEIPAWTFTPGAHKIKVTTAGGAQQSSVKLVVKDCASPKSIVPDQGECKTTLVLSNGTGSFGTDQDTLSAPGADDGIYRTVQISASQGDYVAQTVFNWAPNTVKVKLNNSGWFEDSNADFLRQTGETEVLACDGLNVGTYSVYFKYIFYEDTDSSGGYSDGDTMFQVETSNPVYFELTNAPWITGVNPNYFQKGDRIKVIGLNFGVEQTDGQVFIGSKKQYIDGSTDAVCYRKDCYKPNDQVPTLGKLQLGVKMWSSTKLRIKARSKVLSGTEKNKYVWVVKDGKVSNAKKIKIYAP
jgi:hypothetical protein